MSYPVEYLDSPPLGADAGYVAADTQNIRVFCSLSLLITALFFGVTVQAQEDQTSAPAPANAELPRPSSSATQRPRWEVGIGGGYLWGFDYPASRDINNRGLALPFFIYRTPRFRFGGGGLRAVAIEKPRLKLDLSIGGSLNANSADNSARQDMPDLDFLFELGPQLEVQWIDRLYPSGARLSGRLTAELRAVFSSDFKGVDTRGFVADLGAGVTLRSVAGTDVDLIANFAATFASEKLQDYFYQVDPEYVTPSRASYDARAGYLESTLFTGFGFTPLQQLRVFAGVSTGLFDGAANEQSPLFEVTSQTRFALGIVWTIKSSSDKVDIIELGADS